MPRVVVLGNPRPPAVMVPPELEFDDLVRVVALTGCAWDGNCTYGCPHCDDATGLDRAAVDFVKEYRDRDAVARAERRCSEIASTDRALFAKWAEDGLPPELVAVIEPWDCPF